MHILNWVHRYTIFKPVTSSHITLVLSLPLDQVRYHTIILPKILSKKGDHWYKIYEAAKAVILAGIIIQTIHLMISTFSKRWSLIFDRNEILHFFSLNRIRGMWAVGEEKVQPAHHCKASCFMRFLFSSTRFKVGTTVNLAVWCEKVVGSGWKSMCFRRAWTHSIEWRLKTKSCS